MPSLYFRQFMSGYYSNRNALAPPLQRGEDTVFAGSNMWHHDDLTWKRRPGFSRWFTVNIGNTDAPIRLYPYVESATPKILIDGETTIKRVDTSSTTTTLFTKSGGMIGKETKIAFSNTAGYMVGDGVDGASGFNAQKYKFGGTSTKAWGIYQPSTTPTRSNTAGTLDAVVGYRYRYVWRDSSDGHISGPSPSSVTTGALTNQDQTVTVYGTTQTRADKIDIYRTKDGGSTFYFLATISNPGTATSTTYTDSSPDTSLNTLKICPQSGANDGIYQTYWATGPICWHQERMWVAVLVSGITYLLGSSHAIDGPVYGIAEECFPAALQFKFNGITGIVSTTYGLVILTSGGEIYLLAGRSKYDFVPSKVYDKVPLTQDKACIQDGDTIYVFTSGKELIRLSSTDGVSYFHQPISSTDLSTFDPATAQLAVHRFGNKSLLVISDGDKKLLVYNMTTGTWSTPWQFDGTTVSCNAICTAQTSAGTYDLLIGPKLTNSGYLWKMDTTTNQDDGSVTFSPSLTFGSYVIAEPGQMAQLNSVVTEASHGPTVTFLFQEVSGAAGGTTDVVDEPPLLATPSTLSSQRHYFDRSSTPLVGRHLQLTFTWPSSNQATVFYSFGMQFSGWGQESAA